MSASTDARVSAEDKEDNLVNVGGRDAGTSPVWRVKINNKDHFVQTRLHRDGSITYLANETVGDIQRPYILAQYDKDGVLKQKGGSGRIFYTSNVGTTPSGDVRIGQGPGNLEITDKATAEAILATGTIDGKAATEAEQFDLGYSKALGLSKKRQANTPRNAFVPPDAFVPPPRQTADRLDRDQTVKTPHNATDDPKVEPGESPLNNDSDASNGENTISQFATGLAEGAEDLIKAAIPKAREFLESMTLTEEEIAKFDKLFENGGGDTIENAAYPLDNTYGDIRGQDYVTIDQFIYQPPRRDQILGTGRQNPILNITKGQQRITPLKKFVAQVKLPMPNNITDSNNIAWGDDQMNNLSATLTAGVMRNPAIGLLGGGLGLISPALGKAAALVGIGMDNEGVDGNRDIPSRAAALAKMLEREGGGALMKTQLGAAMLGMLGVNVSAESILARGFGVVPNSNLELLFKNVTLRDFQFSWRMSPRDEQEALMVKKIIRFFKQGMAAKTQTNKAGQRSLYLGTPNIFRLQYRTARGQIIEGVNRIKPCAVTGTAVNYTPDGQWSAYAEGQPVSCTLSIQMKELEPVYASDYSTKVIESRRSGDVYVGEGDLYPIRPTEVGY